MKPEEFFTSKQQLNRYEEAVKLAKKLQKIQKKKGLLLDKEFNIITEQIIFRTDFEEGDWMIVGLRNNNYTYCLIEITYYSDGRPYITTKKEIRNILNSFSFVAKKDIIKISKL